MKDVDVQGLGTEGIDALLFTEDSVKFLGCRGVYE